MTQEEKIKDLEERIAIMDADNSALCADLEHWKKVAAGLKGRNKQLEEMCNDNKNRANQLTDAVSTAIEQNNSRCTELFELKIKLSDYKAIIEWYNELPWWKKMFVGKITY